jgi:hypothetical protein
MYYHLGRKKGKIDATNDRKITYIELFFKKVSRQKWHIFDSQFKYFLSMPKIHHNISFQENSQNFRRWLVDVAEITDL